MFSSILCRVGIVGALAGCVAWTMTAPSSGAPSWSNLYAHNGSDSVVAETSTTPDEEARRREVERLLSPIVLPYANVGAEAETADTTGRLPKVKIRDPFYDYGPALAVQALAEAEAMEKAANKQAATKPTAVLMKRPVAKPVGYGKSTVSAAWRKLDKIKRTALFSKNRDRTATSRFSTGRQTYRSSRWVDAFGYRPQ